MIYKSLKEKIACEDQNKGNRKAVDMLIDEIPKKANFSLPFLKALHGQGHQDIVSELLEGLPNSFRHEIMQQAGISDLQCDPPPPPYSPPETADAQSQEPQIPKQTLIVNQVIGDQEQRLASFQQQYAHNASGQSSPTNDLNAGSSEDNNHSRNHIAANAVPTNDTPSATSAAVQSGKVTNTTTSPHVQTYPSDPCTSDIRISDEDEETFPKSPIRNLESSRNLFSNRHDAISPPTFRSREEKDNGSSISASDGSSTVLASTEIFNEPPLAINMAASQDKTIPLVKSRAEESVNDNSSLGAITNIESQDESDQPSGVSSTFYYLALGVHAALLTWAVSRF